MQVTIPGRPVPKARPRPGRRGHFYVPSQGEQDALAYACAHHRGKFERTDRLAVTLDFHFSGGARPGDIDNLQKLILDALQDAGVIPNDLQIVELHSRIIRPSDRNQTVIAVTKIA